MISFEIFREINSLVSIEKIINRSVKSAELLGRVRDIIVNADNSEFDGFRIDRSFQLSSVFLYVRNEMLLPIGY